MKKGLYIVWKDDEDLACSILNEQHRGIITTVNSLYFLTQIGYNINMLKPTLDLLKDYVIFHLKTEALLLTELEYPAISQVNLSKKMFVNDFDRIAQEAISYNEPDLVLRYIKKWWLSHTNAEHKDYNKYLICD